LHDEFPHREHPVPISLSPSQRLPSFRQTVAKTPSNFGEARAQERSLRTVAHFLAETRWHKDSAIRTDSLTSKKGVLPLGFKGDLHKDRGIEMHLFGHFQAKDAAVIESLVETGASPLDQLYRNCIETVVCLRPRIRG